MSAERHQRNDWLNIGESMTTIAFDGKTMACDTRISSGGTFYNTDTKIYESDAYVIGVAGDAGCGNMLVQVSNILTMRTYGYNFQAIVYEKYTKRVFQVSFDKKWDSDSCVVPVADGYSAVGSGADFARAAMECGCSAQEAVVVASKFDPGTGGKIITKQLFG